MQALFLLRQVAWGADDRGSLHRIIPTVANTLVKHTGAFVRGVYAVL